MKKILALVLMLFTVVFVFADDWNRLDEALAGAIEEVMATLRVGTEVIQSSAPEILKELIGLKGARLLQTIIWLVAVTLLFYAAAWLLYKAYKIEKIANEEESKISHRYAKTKSEYPQYIFMWIFAVVSVICFLCAIMSLGDYLVFRSHPEVYVLEDFFKL